METLTATIAIVGVILILALKPIDGLCVYCLGLFAYPQYVTLAIATIDFSVSRILILVVLTQLIFRFKLYREFRWSRVDSTYLAVWLLSNLALFANESPNLIIVRQSGGFLDSVLPYLAVRLAIRTRDDLLKFIKGLLLIGSYLALIGVYQSVTWHNPMGIFRNYAAWEYIRAVDIVGRFVRHGFYRADVTFGQYIGFGMFFAALCPLCISLKRRKGGWPLSMLIPCFLLLFAGLMSSWSSGPLFSIVVSLGVVAFFPYRRFWKPMVLTFVIFCLFVELYSNRHFYDVLTRFAFNGATASYRIELYEEAFGGGMDDHWICGWGYAGLYSRGPNDPFNWKHRDMTSQYIAALMRFGLLGLAPLLVLTYLYYRRLYQASGLTRNRDDQWMVWCFSAGLIGWSMATFTVAFVGQMGQLSSLLVGIACNMPSIVRCQDSVGGKKQAGLPRPRWGNRMQGGEGVE